MKKCTQPFDVCIVCALYEEAEAVLSEFSTRCQVSFLKEFSKTDRYEYRHTCIVNNRGECLSVLVTWLSDSGPTQTGLDLKPFLHEFRPRFVAMTGFCAGYKKKVKRGDLVVAPYAYFYEDGKVISEAEGRSRHLREMKTAASTSQILHYARGFDGWKEPVKKMKCGRLKRQLKETEEPCCVIAPIASGMAVRQDDPFHWLREYYDRNTVGLDMEAASFYQALRAVSHIHGLVVKGVCDYANMSKKDTYHDYAARVSAVYLLFFIQEYVTEQTMPRRDEPPRSNQDRPFEIWNVPYARNPHFTGREKLLDQIHQYLMPTGPNNPTAISRIALTQPHAIKGLGGIGKTQIVVEYAYRSCERGHYIHTLWINATNEEEIITNFARIAELIPTFSAKDEIDQRKLVEKVKYWLEQCEHQWLLIFDNVDEFASIQKYFPQRGYGSILLTTRANATGSHATSIEVEKMGLIEGVQLLLRRAQRFDDASDEVVNEATNVAIALDCFPLALDQAGAYIEETTCSLTDYLQIYRDHRKALLARRGFQTTNYPDTVATTWSLSFQKIEQDSPAAAEFLRLCAFLAPDNIPEELIRDGAAYWSPLLQCAAIDLFAFNQMVEALLKFSLIQRLVENRMFSIHRLVQAVQVDMIEPEVQRQWAERVIRAVSEAFPNSDMTTWQLCLRYLPQAQACSILIKQYMFMFREAASLLNKTAAYLGDHALYVLAEPLCQQAVQINEQVLSPLHPDTVSNLDQLGYLYWRQGKFEEAEALFQRALMIREQVLDPTHPDIAGSYESLGGLYREQQIKVTQAEQLQQRAVEIYAQILGPTHLRTVNALHNLGWLYSIHGKYKEAESLFQRALAIYEQILNPIHPNMAQCLLALAWLYNKQGRYNEAEPLLQRALEIHKQVLGLTHPSTALSLVTLGSLYWSQGKYEEAEILFQQALEIREQILGPTHPDTAQSMLRLGLVYSNQRRYREAESLYQRAIGVYALVFGSSSIEVGKAQEAYALLLLKRGKLKKAIPIGLRGLRTLGLRTAIRYVMLIVRAYITRVGIKNF